MTDVQPEETVQPLPPQFRVMDVEDVILDLPAQYPAYQGVSV